VRGQVTAPIYFPPAAVAVFVALPLQMPELNFYQNCPEHGSVVFIFVMKCRLLLFTLRKIVCQQLLKKSALSKSKFHYNTAFKFVLFIYSLDDELGGI
jgi:hypothetical protein